MSGTASLWLKVLYYKDLQEAFGSLEHIFGGHDEFLIKDDVLKFHDIPAQQSATSIKACTGVTADGNPYVKGI